MPKIKFEKVLSFSSEDSIHVADNLLNNDPTKKWKCQTPGEKQASVVLQLEKPSIISNLDIGNENSAYIEVLVNRSSSTNDYKGLLVMSSFMTPLESRQGTNINKVRMFTQDQLLKPECNEKWDLIKIICTQPFNRHAQYGLSFITLHSVDSAEDKQSSTAVTSTNLGKFTLRPDSPDNLSLGSFFAKRKQPEETKVKAAVAIREASSSPSTTIKKHSLVKPLLKDIQNLDKKKDDENEKGERVSRNRDEILYADDEMAPNNKIDTIINLKNEETKKRQLDKDEASLNTKREKKIKIDKDQKTSTNGNPSTSKTVNNNKAKPNKKMENESKTKKEKPREKPNSNMKPFNELLCSVTIVISGIQNPDRAHIRSKALEMGAKYKADWDRSCTHLICAFMNTPKYNQVKGKGKIVNKNWVEDCHTQRKKLPWRRYALDKTEKAKPESEDEISELIQEVDSPVSLNNDNLSMEFSKNSSDTEDEIDKVLNKENHNNQSVYDMDTDVEDNQKECYSNGIVRLDDITKFLDIFNGIIFYIDENLDDNQKKLLLQHITAYNGKLSRNISDTINIVITSDENISKIKSRIFNSKFVSTDWIWACHNEQKLIPTDNFEL